MGYFRNFLKCVLLLLPLLGARAAEALVSPVGVAIARPLEFPPASGTVAGVRLGLFRALHESVYGLDFCVLTCQTTKNFGGPQFSLIMNTNLGRSTITGLQMSLVGNQNRGDTYGFGLQLALLSNFNGRGTFAGFDLALLNESYGRVIGAQIGLFNGSLDWWKNSRGVKSMIFGFQLGIINTAADVYGFQIGLLNCARSLHGLQIGLLNINDTGPMPFFPVINVGI